MGRKQRRLAVLLGVLVVGVVAVFVAKQAAGPTGATSYSRTAGRSRSPGTAAQEVSAPAVDVKLEALAAPRPEPIDEGRSPFRFQPKAPPPPPPGPPGRTGATPNRGGTDPPEPTGPTVPPPPPIPLKFIGVLDAPGGGKYAVLTDGRGAVIHGREGEVVEGRYRIVKIGVESIEMEYKDGRGRQSIRLSGS